MFQNAYQGGTHVEIYDAKVNKDKEKSYANLYRMTTPQGYSKVFDKDIKGYIYSIDGHSTKMRFPKEDKIDLCIVQHFLVLQIYLPFGSPWNLEIGIADTQKVNRRINLVSALNKIETKYFHVKVPNYIIRRGEWLNLSIDVNSFMEAWKGTTFRSIDSITIGSTCRIRRIFSMKNPLFEFSSEDNAEEQMYLQSSLYNQQKPEDIPKNFAFPPGFQYSNQLVNYQRILENVDPKYLESVSDSVDTLKINIPASSVPKSMYKNSLTNNTNQVKSVATKSIKQGLGINNSVQKSIPDVTHDFHEKSTMGQKQVDTQKKSYARIDRSPPSIQNTQLQNYKYNSSTKRESSISSSHNLDEEQKYDTNLTKAKPRQASREPARQSLKTQKPPQPQANNNNNPQQGQQVQKNIPKSPINQSLKSPTTSLKDINQPHNSSSRQPTKNQQRQPSTQKKETSSNIQKNNPWYAGVNKAPKKQFDDKGQEDNEEIEENLEAEYYDKYEIDEELPQTIKKKESKTNTSPQISQKTSSQNDRNQKNLNNQNKNNLGQVKNQQIKEKQLTQQLESKRNVKSANNFGKKASLIDPKKTKDGNKKDTQKKENQNDRNQNLGSENLNAFNSMNTDLDEESYFQLTQKFNTVSDPNQFKDLLANSNRKQQAEDSYGQGEYENLDQREIEEDIVTDQNHNNSSINKNGGQNKATIKNSNHNAKSFLKQDTVESKKYQTNRDYSGEKKNQQFEDSLEGPYIQRNLENDDDNYQDELNDKYASPNKDDQGNNYSNHNIYENHLNKFINHSQRPFTPPFQAVVPLQGSSIVTKKNNQTVVIQNQGYYEDEGNYKNEQSKSNISKKSSQANRADNNDFEDQEQLEVIYDPVLNCYYDPNSKQYYELKS
ncbi:hypothetical protein ABPG72_002316 [Tetrahymena utriculariae]